VKKSPPLDCSLLAMVERVRLDLYDEVVPLTSWRRCEEVMVLDMDKYIYFATTQSWLVSYINSEFNRGLV
jgi:hypothetical protein